MTKLTTILLATLGVTATSASNTNSNDLRELWTTWKSINQKVYMSHEEPKRFSTFLENYVKVVNHNKQNSGVKLSLNRFADLTDEEFAAQYSNPLLSTERDLAGNQSHGLGIDYSIFHLPEHVDWRTKGAVAEIKNQNGCPNCYAFSAAASLESLHFIETGKLLSFSEQQIQDCDTTSKGCAGGLRDKALEYTAAHGIELGSDYPYLHKDEPCRYDASKSIKVNSGFRRITPNNVDALKAAVNIQPVSAILQSTEASFKLYKSGVLKADCGTAVNHGVTIVGYTKIDGEEAWIVKNSWGDAWGEKGYVYIATDGSINGGKGVCGILSDPLVPTKLK